MTSSSSSSSNISTFTQPVTSHRSSPSERVSCPPQAELLTTTHHLLAWLYIYAASHYPESSCAGAAESTYLLSVMSLTLVVERKRNNDATGLDRGHGWLGLHLHRHAEIHPRGSLLFHPPLKRAMFRALTASWRRY